MREILVTELVKEVLGPRHGRDEVLNVNPVTEYITGVLAPKVRATSRDVDDDSEIPADESMTSEEEDDDLSVNTPPMLAPPLDPDNRPSSMGMSFVLESQVRPAIRVCLTWARYVSGAARGTWIRNPRSWVRDLTLQQANEVIYIDSQGRETTSKLAEISLHIYCGIRAPNRYSVSLYLKNEVEAEQQELLGSGPFVFQPQIRVAETESTRVVRGIEKLQRGEEERALEFLYRNRPVLAQGHLCSAVWRDIDPEVRPVAVTLDFTASMDEPPFHWLDGDTLDPTVRAAFSPAAVRTEFVPMYSIPYPDYSWRTGNEGPQLNALGLSELWDPREMRNALQPILDGFADWIETMQRNAARISGDAAEVAALRIADCSNVRNRIQRGVDLVCSDEEVRLAFCFANRALDTQSGWSRGHGLRWRPFQLAFILMCIESVISHDSPDRMICDLLWVPTGAGKTEAYLGVAAFDLAYRRRRARRNGQSEEGVAVITRYTLRLLTIQQFRRTLATVAACEYLRVASRGDEMGWRPLGCTNADRLLWGKSPFSLGLWVGGEVTPNRLQHIPIVDASGSRSMLSGALELLRRPSRGRGPEPAQVLRCPACATTLAVSSMGLRAGTQPLHLVIRSNSLADVEAGLSSLVRVYGNIEIRSTPVLVRHPSENYATLSLMLHSDGRMMPAEIDDTWTAIRGLLGNPGLQCVRASRPGYFLRHYIQQNGNPEEYDFDIFCPSPSCHLHRPWSGYTRAGIIHGRSLSISTATLEDYHPIEVQEAFRNGSEFNSDRIPILAYTVDDQVYMRVPSVLIATADKFARGPFEPRVSSIFGNVTSDHCVYGYYRPFDDQNTQDPSEGHRTPIGRPNSRNYVQGFRLLPPDLILQDELHLIEGALGSLFGIYETAVDFLTEGEGMRTKYIASSATVRNAGDQVRSVFSRGLQLFPPIGLEANDRFFMNEEEKHPADDRDPGRLYVGVCAPGRGPLTPLVRIWSSLMQTVWTNREHQSIDPYWTLTGYFNAIRELGGARALYRQDIPQRISFVAPNVGRPIAQGLEDRTRELSGRTQSMDLPAILELLDEPYPNAQDVLFTTAMFGTGVDIQRLGLMVVNGQPKTTSSYIQSTGRVGRSRGGLVVTFFRAAKPRDLNHYEFFTGYHRQLHRFVEPITVYPFAPGVLDRAAGPVAVFMLRSSRSATIPWLRDDSARLMATNRSTAPEIGSVISRMEGRALEQPGIRQPVRGSVADHLSQDLDSWRSTAHRRPDLTYVEYAISRPPTRNVVLGDDQHQQASQRGIEVVYRNAPQSLRDIEEMTGFETGVRSTAQSLRKSQFIYTYGPGAILESTSGPRLVPKSDIGLFGPNGVNLSAYEIPDPRITEGLLGHGGRVYRLPSNADLNRLPVDPVYSTRPFPVWLLCLNTPAHNGNFSVLYSGGGCPVCGLRAVSEPIRFIRACTRGHLDDIDWSWVVHARAVSHPQVWYRWFGGGGSLGRVRIECSRCTSGRNFGEAYGLPWPCSGRYPEGEPLRSQPLPFRCDVPAHIIQRQASNLRIPELRTLFSIPYYTQLHRDLRIPEVRGALRVLQGRINTLEDFRGMLNNLRGEPSINQGFVDGLLRHPWEEIREAIRVVLAPVAVTYDEMIREEFRFLLEGSRSGVPPQPRNAGLSSPLIFEINPNDVRTVNTPAGRTLRITPVRRLSTVTVLTGYRREVDTEGGAESVDISFQHGTDSWYPGVEFLGEGMLVTLEQNEGWQDSPSGESAETWQGAWQEVVSNPAAYPRYVFRGPSSEELHPGFVWWHSLSHLLIRSISAVSGYAGASIRERVYLQRDQSRIRGGALVYATQPGSEGTMGGLIALTPHFENILNSVFADIETCSSDPLCEENRFQSGQYNGAACYGCLLLSETSCEHRNMWLDRNVFRENPI